MIKALLIGLIASASAQVLNPDLASALKSPLRGDTEPVTEDNYALAETQSIFSKIVKKIADATKTKGLGIFLHEREVMDPGDKSVMRTNYDTLYSIAVLDLTKPVTLVLPETQERYQTAWVVTEEEYNPFSNPNMLSKPGSYEITKEKVGSPYIMVIVRTQVNMLDDGDVAAGNTLQDQLKLTQVSLNHCAKSSNHSIAFHLLKH
jgi:hypothetical protein